MLRVKSNTQKQLLRVGIIGAILTAICCFTPVLVLLFSALGIAAWTGYLDYVLLPLLGSFLLLIAYASLMATKSRDSSHH